ncbi:MAG: hypothetical protein JXR96_26140, partial [Deltaproteobacteria bacterium]|nr:hypothetical protein [Deltaproteobacteria bacterium]
MRQIGFILVACLGAWACSEGGGIDETPCDPNPCTAVQPAACNGNLLETYASPGECAVVEGTVQCTYPVAQSTDCAASGQVCDPDSAACVGCLIDSDCAAGEVCRDKTCVGSSDPCDPNPCTDAPAPACNGDVAETYSSPGTCTEQDNNPICTYPVSESTDCEALGQVCDPDTVTCVDCVEDADCQSPFLVCQDHACTAGCIDDSREPNDDVASATAVQQDALWADLVLCAGTEDYYAVVAAQGDVISALIDFAHADGDLDLELIGPDGS